MKNLKSFVEKSLIFILAILICFLFLSFCNWSINLPDWNEFSRVIFALFGFFIFLSQIN